MVSTIEGGVPPYMQRKLLHTTTYANLAEQSRRKLHAMGLAHILIVSLIQDHQNNDSISLIFAEETKTKDFTQKQMTVKCQQSLLTIYSVQN